MLSQLFSLRSLTTASSKRFTGQVIIRLLKLITYYLRATIHHNSLSSHHYRDSTMATLLSAIVLVFLFSHSTKLLTNFYEGYQVLNYGELRYWPPWASLLSKWNHLMLTVNSSVNIFIYVIKVKYSIQKSHKDTRKFQDSEFRSAFSTQLVALLNPFRKLKSCLRENTR